MTVAFQWTARVCRRPRVRHRQVAHYHLYLNNLSFNTRNHSLICHTIALQTHRKQISALKSVFITGIAFPLIMEFCVVYCNVHTDCTQDCATMTGERKEFPLRIVPSGCFNNWSLNMTFQNYCSTSANKDYNFDRATVFVCFLAAHARGCFQSYPDKPVWETWGLIKKRMFAQTTLMAREKKIGTWYLADSFLN